ncbi:MAG: hypothetical protein DRP65_10870 [Planctomycetota bacterium]|nr:MAG: hypothetical protein DRP65_10870 [Planctomycetota bacterium]
MPISDHVVVEKVFRRGRWDAVLDRPFDGQKTIPYAHYVWLSGNPSFESIPKGYVVHHLDHDETNDDISNLVIMQKHHHVAHHMKSKIVTPSIVIDPKSSEIHVPTKKPRAYKDSKSDRWYLQYYYRSNGKIHKGTVYKHGGRPFATKDAALDAIKEIWPWGGWQSL